MSTASRVIKNTGFLYAKMGITMFVSLYTTRLLLNSLGASDFGIFKVVGGAIAMLGFLNAAMASATQRFMSYAEGEGKQEKKKNIFNISVLLHLAIACILGGVLLIAGYFFFNGILNIPADRVYAAKVVYGSMIISTMFTVMTVPYDALLNARENMLYYAIVGIIESFLKLAVAIIVVYVLKDKLIIYGVLMAVISLLVMLIMRIYCHRHYEECTIAPKRYWDSRLMKEMTGFAGWNLLGTASGMIGNYGNVILINHFFGTVINAALGIVNQLNGQLLVFSNNMLKALNPVIVKKQGEGSDISMLDISLKGSKFSFFLFSLFAIPMLMETPFILNIWLKETPIYTVVFMRLQLIRGLLEQISITLGTSLAAKGNIRGLNISMVFSYLVPLPLLYILFTLGFQPYWMYITGIIFMVLVGSGFKIYYCIKLCNLKLMKWVNKVVLPCLIVFLTSVFILFMLRFFLGEGLIRLSISIILSTFMILFLGYYTLESEEKYFLTTRLFKLKFDRNGK